MSEQADTLRSTSFARLVDVLCEGPIEGLVDGARSIFLDETPLQNADGSFNFQGFTWQERKGTSTQDYVPGFAATESVTAVGVKVQQATPVVRNITNTAADAALVTLGFPALQSTNQATGDIGGTAVSMKIEVKTSSGPWVNVSTTDDPRAMDAVDASTVRMPASTLATRADIRVAFVDVAAPVALPFRIEYRTVGSGTWLTWAESAAVASSATTRMETGAHDGGETATTVYSGAVTVTVRGMTAARYEFRIVPLAVVPYTPTITGTYYTALEELRVVGKASSRYQRQVRVALPAGGAPWSIRVTRLTADSASAYLQNESWWDNITEVVDEKLRYPFTALVAMSIDAQQFGQIPARAYDVKLLRVQVPVNYDPLTRVYTGSWDGTFKTAWTDNPAWCLYDLLTNTRYGLGAFVGTGVDKWSLYQIAQYCDELVPDGTGGQEPRFTCNVLIGSKAEAFKVVNDLASVFRGMVYWASGTITPVQDAPRDPVALFAPANVIDGQFNYSGSSSKVRHTACLVTWNDPADLCKQKVEYVEDRAGIERYGLVMTDVAAFGCTSRSQAHRVGKWLLYSERLQTDAVQFKAGMDAAVIHPGDIIKVADPGRAGVRFGGRVRSATTSAVTLDTRLSLIGGETYTLSTLKATGAVQDAVVTEASRRNLLTWTGDARNTSEAGATRPWSQFDDTGDAVRTVLVSGTGPDGITGLLSEVTANTTGVQQRQVSQAPAGIADNVSLVASVYLKAVEVQHAVVYVATKSGVFPSNVVNLTTGTNTVTASGASGVAGGVEDAGNGWWRVWITANIATGATPPAIIIGLRSASGNYGGAVGDGLLMWGPQLEVGTTPTAAQWVGATWDATKAGGMLQTLPVTLTEAPQAGSMWVLSTTSVQAQLFQVLTVSESEPNVYEIAAIEHDPSKYSAIENDTALQLRSFSRLTVKPAAPTNLVVGEALVGIEAAPRSRLDVSWSLASRANSYAVRWRRDNGPWSAELTVVNTAAEIPDATVGSTYTIEVSSVSGLGIRSATAATISYTVLGKAALPSDVTGFVVARVGDLLTFSWRAVTDLDIKAYELRRGDTWETSVAVGSTATNNFATVGQRGGKYLIKALDTSGNYSANAALVAVEDASGINVVITSEEAQLATGGTWPGTMAGLMSWVQVGADEWGGASTWANAASWSNFNLKGGPATPNFGPPFSGTYTSSVVDIGAVMTSLVTLEAVVEPLGTPTATDAISASYEMRTSLDGLTWGSWASFTPGSYRGRFFQVRVTLSATSATYRAWLTRLAIIVDVPDRVENFADVAVPAEGATITFPTPFVGVSTVQVTLQSGAIGDTYRVTDKTTTSVRVQVFNSAGTAKAVLVDVDVYGYGYRT